MLALIDAEGVYYKNLNKKIKELIAGGELEITLENVNGQRYVGDGIKDEVKININGTPGNDMAAFAGGVNIEVKGNVQDAVANTMNSGKVIVHGNAGDVLGYSMRGGDVFIKGKTGYRTGIHMKGFKDKQPTIIIGETAGDFFGEYMAGGRLILLGLNRKKGEPIIGNYIGTGMHGGIIYIRDRIEEYKVGLEVKVEKAGREDRKELRKILKDYCNIFDYNIEKIMNAEFSRLTPVSSRPYGNLYAY